MTTELNGNKLSLVDDLGKFDSNYEVVKLIPTYLWYSKILECIPCDPKYRRDICLNIFDSKHYDICQTKASHPHATPECIFSVCYCPAMAYLTYTCNTTSKQSETETKKEVYCSNISSK